MAGSGDGEGRWTRGGEGAVDAMQVEVQKVRHTRCLRGAESPFVPVRRRPTTNIFKRKHLQKITKNQDSGGDDDVATWPYSGARPSL